MSVEIYNVEEPETKITIPVSSERYFCSIWETAIKELGILTLGNGVWLKKEELKQILEDFQKVEEWAKHKLENSELEYVCSHIDRICEMLPTEWSKNPEIKRLWMG